MRVACHAAVAPADRRLFEAGWPARGWITEPDPGRSQSRPPYDGAVLMRVVCNAAVAPADRRLFEAGWPARGWMSEPFNLTRAGLKVGRHMTEQF